MAAGRGPAAGAEIRVRGPSSRSARSRAQDLRAALLAKIARDGGGPPAPFSDPEHGAVTCWRICGLASPGRARGLRRVPPAAHQVRRECAMSRAPWSISNGWNASASRRSGEAAVDRYRYPPRKTTSVPDDEAKLPSDDSLGTVEAVDKYAGTIDIRKRVDQNDIHPTTHHRARHLQRAEAGSGALPDRRARHCARAGGRDGGAGPVLARPSPALAGFGPPGVGISGRVRRADRRRPRGGQLAIQGPPGAGKTQPAPE